MPGGTDPFLIMRRMSQFSSRKHEFSPHSLTLIHLLRLSPSLDHIARSVQVAGMSFGIWDVRRSTASSSNSRSRFSALQRLYDSVDMNIAAYDGLSSYYLDRSFSKHCACRYMPLQDSPRVDRSACVLGCGGRKKQHDCVRKVLTTSIAIYEPAARVRRLAKLNMFYMPLFSGSLSWSPPASFFRLQ